MAAPATAHLRSPFTGGAVRSLNRVLAVKIDNIVYVRPQTGLTHTDIFYVLPVEGGLSRFLAVFSSGYPRSSGRAQRPGRRPGAAAPVRPAPFAYSGATGTLLPYIHRAARIVDLYDGIAGGCFRDTSRIARTTCTPTRGSC